MLHKYLLCFLFVVVLVADQAQSFRLSNFQTQKPPHSLVSNNYGHKAELAMHSKRSRRGWGLFPFPTSNEFLWEEQFPEARVTTTLPDLGETYSSLLGADVVEGANDYHIHVDLPGVKLEDLEVVVTKTSLNIKAERKVLYEENIGFTHRIERTYGVIQRSIPIPPSANADSAQAKFENGVLTVRVDKVAGCAASGKKLEIKMG